MQARIQFTPVMKYQMGYMRQLFDDALRVNVLRLHTLPKLLTKSSCHFSKRRFAGFYAKIKRNKAGRTFEH